MHDVEMMKESLVTLENGFQFFLLLFLYNMFIIFHKEAFLGRKCTAHTHTHDNVSFIHEMNTVMYDVFTSIVQFLLVLEEKVVFFFVFHLKEEGSNHVSKWTDGSHETHLP